MAVAIAESWTPVEETFVPYQALKTMAINEANPKKDRKIDSAENKGTAPAVFQTEFQRREARLIAWRQSDAGKLAISNYICRNCGKKGHMAKECRSPRKTQVFATTAEESGVTMEEYAAYFDADDDDQSNYEFEYKTDISNSSDREEVWQEFVVNTVNYDSDGMPELIDASDFESEDEDLPPTYMVALSTQVQMVGSLSLDTQSSVNITPDANLLTNIKHCRPILVGGINKNGVPLKIAKSGYMDGIEMYYNPGAVCSILSQSKLLSTGAKLAFLSSRNSYWGVGRKGPFFI
jgi:hypothetical protein